MPYYLYRQKNTVGNLDNAGYAKEGCESIYNIIMMGEYHTVFGVGAGSVTKLVSQDMKKVDRIFAPKYPYEFLDKEPFETEYGVVGMVREQQKAFRSTYAKYNIIGTVLCVLSPIILFIGMFSEIDLLAVLSLSLMLLVIAIACVYFILAGVRWASMQKLLKEGEYSPQGKARGKVKETVSTVYWLTVVAIFLGWSFVTDGWHSTWVIWPVAGVLYAAVMVLCSLLLDRGSRK